MRHEMRFAFAFAVLFGIGALAPGSFGGCTGTRKIASEIASPLPAAVTKPRHVVFLIHGIGGNKTHFGSMQQALKNVLPKLEDRYSYDVVNFEYDTANDNKDTYLFARELGETIHAYFEASGAAPQAGEKISLVMHSQGGLIGMIWMTRAFSGEAEYHPEYAAFVDGYITLGTPFWGAKIAVFAGMLKKAPSELIAFLPTGRVQLREMSFGSETIFRFRQRVMQEEFLPILAKMRQQVRPLHLAGVARDLKLLSPFVTGKTEYEDDTAVPLPSARFDFIYAKSDKTSYSSGERLKSESFGETRLSKFIVVDALHLSPFPNRKALPGLAQIPKACVDDPQCKHPTFQYVVNQLLGRSMTIDESLLAKMTSFLIDLNVRLPAGHGLKANDFKVKFITKKADDVKIGKMVELYSKGRSKAARNPEYVRFYYTGTIANSFLPLEERPGEAEEVPFRDKVVEVEISAPGYKTRVIEAKVRATYSTFVDLNLERN
ncbi:MAG TPA: alpha/beta fold hydrolase [Bdellovibrionota bacterium]|nr:alpha/beta fold hydrolase [Bdellovibrionota bacterium]